jgi:putative restriction endonuclease
LLNNPIFFKQEDWIKTPSDWANNIVQGKSYNTNDETGKKVWQEVEKLLLKYSSSLLSGNENSNIVLESNQIYRNQSLVNIRIGQGAFRVLITENYNRKCAITGEKTLPVLEAAHIQSYSENGPNITSNGILLRSDMHKLFDAGYLTITKEYRIEVSKRIKEEFHNGKEYYQYHGKELFVLPQKDIDKPNISYLDWHNIRVFRG